MTESCETASHDADGARCWVAVVSRKHVMRGIAGGFAQVCHGKAAPLRRMRTGDWLVFYSPTETFGGTVPCRRFTALGRVHGNAVYPVDMGGGFVPYRRDVAFLAAGEAEIRPLLPHLTFIPDLRRWGFPFRCGHFEIPAADLARIAAAMGTSLGDAAAVLPTAAHESAPGVPVGGRDA